MSTYYQRQQKVAELLKETLNSLLENDSNTEINFADKLKDNFKELNNSYHNLPEIKPCDIKQSTSADGWKYAKRK